MDTKFNVFDEWGNFIGRFTAVGSGADNCAVMVAFLIMGVIISVIYMLFRLIIEGFKALFAGRLGMAFVYWAIPLLLVGLIAYFNISKGVEANIEAGRLTELEQSIVVSYRLGDCSDVDPDPNYEDNRCYVSFTVTSKSDVPLHIWLLDDFSYECDTIDVYGVTLVSGATRNFLCTVPPDEKLVTHTTDSYNGIDELSLCFDLVAEADIGAMSRLAVVCP